MINLMTCINGMHKSPVNYPQCYKKFWANMVLLSRLAILLLSQILTMKIIRKVILNRIQQRCPLKILIWMTYLAWKASVWVLSLQFDQTITYQLAFLMTPLKCSVSTWTHLKEKRLMSKTPRMTFRKYWLRSQIWASCWTPKCVFWSISLEDFKFQLILGVCEYE